MMSHVFGGSCKTLIKMKKHHVTLFLFMIVGSFMIEEVKGTTNPLVDFSTREELVHVAGYGEEKLSTVIITGQVLCLSCVDAEAQLPPTPVLGAYVVVLCGHGKKRKPWASSVTDEYGDFLIDLPSHLHAIPDLEKFCYVNTIQESRNYNMLSCINGSKRRKIKLMYIDDGIRTYTTENILLRSKSNTKEACNKISVE